MKDHSKVTDLEDKFDILVDANDVILERVVSKLFLLVAVTDCSVTASSLFLARMSVVVHSQLHLVFPQSGGFLFNPWARSVVTAAEADGLWPKRKNIIGFIENRLMVGLCNFEYLFQPK